MKKIFFLIFLNILLTAVHGQRSFFLYLQSESEQPFYLKMGERIFSSASKGYLILPQLRDSTYNFAIGFPGKNSNEQKFSVKMAGKDHGYLVKNFEEKGWGLFDLQTLTVQMANNNQPAPEIKRETINKDESAFTQILAKASDDSTLLEKTDLSVIGVKKAEPEIKETVNRQEEKIKEKIQDTVFQNPVQPVLIPEQNKADNPEEKKTEETEKKGNQPVVPEYRRSVVERKSESSTTEGFGIFFTDLYSNGQKDTIRIVIPAHTGILKTPDAEKIDERKGEEKKFLEMPDTVKAVTVTQAEAAPVIVSPAQTSANRKTDCKSVAEDGDFLKLRKNMAGLSDDEEMISEAKKMFKLKCFTTVQIKNLSLLFLTDEGKYKFFDSSYRYISDFENFSTLQTELKDEYFINRFKAMLR